MKTLSKVVQHELLKLPEIARLGPLPKGQWLLRDGASQANVYYLESGLIKLIKSCGNDRRFVVGLVTPGEFIGLYEAIANKPATLLTSVAHEATVYAIPERLLRDYCESHPSSWRWFADLASQSMQLLESRLEVYQWPEAEQRLLALLPFLAERCAHLRSEDGGTLVPLKQEEIASLIGATRETTSSILNLLGRRGEVKLGRGKIVLPRRAVRA
jgi:CRP/FNR family transcriptional regulator